jgi:hypothetical protein
MIRIQNTGSDKTEGAQKSKQTWEKKKDVDSVDECYSSSSHKIFNINTNASTPIYYADELVIILV